MIGEALVLFSLLTKPQSSPDRDGSGRCCRRQHRSHCGRSPGCARRRRHSERRRCCGDGLRHGHHCQGDWSGCRATASAVAHQQPRPVGQWSARKNGATHQRRRPPVRERHSLPANSCATSLSCQGFTTGSGPVTPAQPDPMQQLLLQLRQCMPARSPMPPTSYLPAPHRASRKYHIRCLSVPVGMMLLQRCITVEETWC